MMKISNKYVTSNSLMISQVEKLFKDVCLLPITLKMVREEKRDAYV